MKQRTLSFFAALLLVFVVVSSVATVVHPVSAQGIPVSNTNPGSGIPVSNTGGKIPNPLNSDAKSIVDFLKIVLQNVVIPLGVVVIILLVMYSGYLFVTAQGDAKKIQAAKDTLKYVLIGAAILLGATVIAEVIQATLCQITTTAC